MKFIDLFHKTGDKLYPDWNTILSIKEFRDLGLCQQSTVWHKEGNALVHVTSVTNHMVNYFHDNGLPMNDDYYIQMVSAALCHDLGKPSTTKWEEDLQEYKTKCHGQVGARITRKLFFDEPDIELREKVCCMVKNHMTLHHILDSKKEIDKKLKRLSWNMVTVKDMLLLKHCDSLGSKNDVETPEMLDKVFNEIKENAERLDCYEKPFQFENNFERLKYFYGVENSENYDEHFLAIIMVGLPGAGKDTFIKSFSGDNGLNVNLSNLPMLCRDLIRTEIGIKGEKPQGNKAQEDKVTDIFNKRMMELCKDHKSFIVNNTNLLKKYRQDYCKKVIEHGGTPIFVYVEAPTLEETKKRREGQIKPEIIDNMFWRFEFPEPSECLLPMVLYKH